MKKSTIYHRFFGDFNLSEELLTLTDPELLHQLKTVLRFKVGDDLVLVSNKKEALVSINSLSPKEGTVFIRETNEEKDPVKRVLHLYLSLLKRDNFELAVAKAVECGATTITPIITSRTIKTGLNKERIIRIIKEGAEQSGRMIIPSLNPTLSFRDALLHSVTLGNVGFIGDTTLPTETSPTLPLNKNLALFIGPEGGFSEEELLLAKRQSIVPFSLGESILRAETAVIVAVHRFSQGN